MSYPQFGCNSAFKNVSFDAVLLFRSQCIQHFKSRNILEKIICHILSFLFVSFALSLSLSLSLSLWLSLPLSLTISLFLCLFFFNQAFDIYLNTLKYSSFRVEIRSCYRTKHRKSWANILPLAYEARTLKYENRMLSWERNA